MYDISVLTGLLGWISRWLNEGSFPAHNSKMLKDGWAKYIQIIVEKAFNI